VKLILEDISRELARIGTSGSFASRRTAAAGDLILEVQDLGRIWLPVTASIARRLCEVARPARHDFKDGTVSIAASVTRGRSQKAASLSTSPDGRQYSFRSWIGYAATLDCPRNAG